MKLQDLLLELDRAIEQAGCPEQAVECTCAVLRQYPSVDLPPRLRQETTTGCYARHLVHHKGDGYCVVAMVWGPGQGTAVHDHDGTWCVEGCLQGKLDVTSFRVLERGASDDELRLAQESVVSVAQGGVGSLIPPFEHHKIHNSYDQPAITLHVYGKELSQCTRYKIDHEDWFRAERVDLTYTSLPETLTA